MGLCCSALPRADSKSRARKSSPQDRKRALSDAPQFTLRDDATSFDCLSKEPLGLSQPLAQSCASPKAKATADGDKAASNPYGSISSADVHLHQPSPISAPAPPEQAPVDLSAQLAQTFTPPAEGVGAPSDHAQVEVGMLDITADLRRKHPSMAHVQPSVQKQDNNFHISYKTSRCILRLQGSMPNRAYCINDLSDCDVYILDSASQLQIDDCVDCTFFVGPVSGSAFLRDCKNCKFVMMCRQFRCRDLESCDVMLHSRTPPVVESSTNVGFCCWVHDYKGLSEQMAFANLSVFHNFWSSVHNFTPREEASWKYIDGTGIDMRDHACVRHRIPDDVLNLLETPSSTTFATAGDTLGHNALEDAAAAGQYCGMFVPASALAAGEGQATDAAARTAFLGVADSCDVVHVNKIVLTANEAITLSKAIQADGSTAALPPGNVWCMEMTGVDAHGAAERAKSQGFLATMSAAVGGSLRTHGLAS